VIAGYALEYYLIDLSEYHSDGMTVADYIAMRLHDAGVRYVFGIPGGPSIPYMEAFKKSGIEFILVSNEAAAGIMADVTARLTGIPGVCHATFGPGATNISTGVGGAYLDRSPVIVLTSEMDDRMINRISQMNINHQRLFEPITKATFRMNAANAREVMDSSLRICKEEYPGPVHIGLPTDIAEKDIIESGISGSDISKPGRTNDVEKIVSLLGETQRPLLAVGLTAKRLRIGHLLTGFLERYRIPVVITPMAKGILPAEHPSLAGVLSHALSDCIEDIYERTDLVIGIGYDSVEYNYESWMPDVPLIHFDTRDLDMPEAKNATGYTGKPEEWFSILANLKPGNLVSELNTVVSIRDEIMSVFEGFTGRFGPVAVLKILREELPRNTILTADVGSHLHLAGQYWDPGDKGDFIITNGWSGMGFGLPAALASQMVNPDSPVVCLTGDGGFLMMAGEILTALRYNLPVITIVLSDGELNLIKLKQSWKDLPPYGTTLYQGDLFGADVFLGVRVLKADSHESMRKAVISALSVHEPVIINAVIDPEDYKWIVVKK
jgi:acetolactate synthase-1/2/3 large subunit